MLRGRVSGFSAPKPLWLSVATITVIVLYGAALLVSLFLPAFIDDVFSPIQDSRAGYDGWYTISVFPLCWSSFLTKIPLPLLAGRGISWLVHAATGNFHTMRVIAILILLGWMAYLGWFLKRCIMPGQPMHYILGGILGFAGLGTLPFALLLNRPETAMIFAVTFYASVPFLIARYPRPSPPVMAMAAVVFLLVTSWFASAHPKALFYSPLVVLAAAYACRWHKTGGIMLTALSAWTLFEAWQDYWRTKITCIDYAPVTSHLERRGLTPSQLLADSGKFWHDLLHNLLHGTEYINGILFPGTDFLPPAATGTAEAIANPLIAGVILCVVLCVAAGVVAVARHARRHHTLKCPAISLVLCLLAALVAQWAIQSAKMFYNCGLVWVTLGLCLIMLADYARTHGLYGKGKGVWTAYGCLGLWAVVILSQCTLLFTYIPATFALWQQDAPGGVIPGYDLLIATQYSAQTETRIREAAQSCGIAADAASRHVVVDNYTYMAMKKTYQPFRVSVVFSDFDVPGNFLGYMKVNNSSGLITLCETLPDYLRPLATAHEGLCCMSKQQIQDIKQ